MQANALHFSHGWRWLREGFQLWRRSPALIAFASFGYLLALLVISVFPFIGQLAATLLMPALSMGVMNACRAVDRNERIGPEVLFSGFRHNLPALIGIGGLYLIASILVLLLVGLFDDGSLAAVLQGGGLQLGELNERQLASLRFTLLIGVALSTPVMMAYWFAPILAAWWQLPSPKALFFSFIACLRNWRPFLVYAIAITVCGVLLPGLIIAVLGMVSPLLASLLALPLPLLLIPVLFASFYTSARAVFGLPGQPATLGNDHHEPPR